MTGQVEATRFFPVSRQVIIPIDVYTTLIQMLAAMQPLILGIANFSRDPLMLHYAELMNNIVRDMALVFEAVIEEGVRGHDYTKSVRVKQ